MDTETTKQIFQPDKETHGLYKIEFMFGPDRSTTKEFNACMTFYHSARHFHGGGDGGILLCLNGHAMKDLSKRDSYLFYRDVLQGKVGGNGCGLPLLDQDIGGGAAFCRNCNRAVNALALVGQLYFRGTVQELANVTAEIFRRGFNSDADIACKYDLTDIRVVSMTHELGAERAHELRGRLVYPLGRILKDISTGATLEGRFKAAFSA